VDVLFLFILIVAAFLMLVVLPTRARNRQVQALQQMQRSLEIGTEVMTSSGVYGRLVRLGADDVDLEIAPGVITTWMLLAIREVKSPTRAPAAGDAPELESIDEAELVGSADTDLDDELDEADRAELDALPETEPEPPAEPESPPAKGRRKRPGAGAG
jgi:preprotein translocase subunit YajC